MELKDAAVLIVDDEPMLLEIFGEWLQEESCHVLTAGDGADHGEYFRTEFDPRMKRVEGISPEDRKGIRIPPYLRDLK